MSENVDNLLLEQLRLIREDIGGLKTHLDAFQIEVRTGFSDVRSDLLGQRTTYLWRFGSLDGGVNNGGHH